MYFLFLSYKDNKLGRAMLEYTCYNQHLFSYAKHYVVFLITRILRNVLK